MPISTIGSNSLNQTSDLTINGVTVGEGGGSVSTNTAVGASALAANTTGASNTAIGSSALQANTTASNNTAVGYQAGIANTTGRITAFGHRVLYGNTTGTGNTGVGGNDGSVGSALLSNTTGSYNIAVGTGALLANTTASSNTAVGYQAGYNNTVGQFNVLLGYQAGYRSAGTGSIGDASVLIGYQAGYANQGNNNVGIGNGALSANTSGTFNTCVGQGSGSAITTGGKNVILGGYNGNNLGLDIRTLSNNIVLSNGDGSPYFWIDSYGNNHIGLSGSGSNPPVYNNGGDPAATVGFMSAMPSTVSRINIQERAGKWTTWVDGGGTSYGVVSVNGAGVTYGSNSDYRLKENVTPLTGALERVTNLKPVKFKWIIDGTLSEGFIAHEVQEIIPLAVKGEKDGMADDNSGRPLHQTLDASMIIPTLTAAIQELKTIVDAQAAEIAELKAKVA